jgi:hypothetical protein
MTIWSKVRIKWSVIGIHRAAAIAHSECLKSTKPFLPFGDDVRMSGFESGVQIEAWSSQKEAD